MVRPEEEGAVLTEIYGDSCTPGEKESKLLFFSGGTALKETAKELSRRHANSVHVITTFDSGGSSAKLRKAFDMPAVGDIRSRLMALANSSAKGVAEVYTLFSYRFPEDGDSLFLQRECLSLVKGTHPLLRQLPVWAKEAVAESLRWFIDIRPSDFSLQGASIGNLLLASHYLRHERCLERAIEFYASMVCAQGEVLPVAHTPAHLAVRLASGEVIIGQHRFTGKETTKITSPIEKMWLTKTLHDPNPATVMASSRVLDRIHSVEAICYPIGSFYSSVLANLLPKGVGEAVAQSKGRKVFTPNLGVDPELSGHTLKLQVEQLLDLLLLDAKGATPKDVLQFILVDKEKGDYEGGIPESWFQEIGLKVIHAPLVAMSSAPFASSKLLADALLNFLKRNFNTR